MSDIITILLATYNGEKYLSHQINSLLNQSYSNWRLIIRDDCSTDNTPVIIESFCKKYPDKISFLDNGKKNSGSIMNFSMLFSAAINSEYIMFCDQDDEWMNNKIEVTFNKMKELENTYGSNYPILVFTDFLYVDEKLNVIESKKKFTVNKFKEIAFPQILVQNPAYGCTCMLNSALIKKVVEIPAQAENHDYWTALVAAAFGKLYYFPQKTILYRQHSKNVSGNYNDNSFRKRLQRVIFQQQNIAMLAKKRRMLLKFKEMYYKHPDFSFRKKFDDFIKLYTNKSLLLIWRNFGNGIRSQTIIQTILFYISILFYKNNDQVS